MILNRAAFRTLPHPIPHLPQRTGCQADELLLSFVHSFDAPEPGQCGDEVKPELIQHVCAMKVVNSANIHTTALTARLFVIAFNLFIGDTLNNKEIVAQRVPNEAMDCARCCSALDRPRLQNFCSIGHLSDGLSDRDSPLRSQNLALPPGGRESTSTMPSRDARHIRLQADSRGPRGLRISRSELSAGRWAVAL